MMNIRLLASICSIILFLIVFGGVLLILTVYQVEIEADLPIPHMTPQAPRYEWRTRDSTATNVGLISIAFGMVVACGLIIWHMKETKKHGEG